MPPRRLLAVLLVATLDYTLRHLWGSWGQERQLATEPLAAGARRFEQTHGLATNERGAASLAGPTVPGRVHSCPLPEDSQSALANRHGPTARSAPGMPRARLLHALAHHH